MPRENTNTITPPSFDDFNAEVSVVTETIDTSIDGTSAAQDIIFNSGWTTLFMFSLGLSLIFAVGIIYSIMRLMQIRKLEKEYYASQPLSSAYRKTFGIEDASISGGAYGERWRNVLTHVNSENSNDWRQAILEADVMLDDAISSRGYIGEGIGEKMKQVERGDINTIDDAWEAHKMRNRIAHEGTDFELNQRDARRIIGLYENVFRELEYI